MMLLTLGQLWYPGLSHLVSVLLFYVTGNPKPFVLCVLARLVTQPWSRRTESADNIRGETEKEKRRRIRDGYIYLVNERPNMATLHRERAWLGSHGDGAHAGSVAARSMRHSLYQHHPGPSVLIQHTHTFSD